MIDDCISENGGIHQGIVTYPVNTNRHPELVEGPVIKRLPLTQNRHPELVEGRATERIPLITKPPS
ncbi:MAG: hypothetical protein GF331_10970 [Chitinivibrionales bacterium]|nr:hypothetical protein [Chitinivibrionales bacterium]